MAQLPAARSQESSYRQHCCQKYCNYHCSDQCDCDDCQSDYRHQEDQCHDCPWCTDKDSKCSKSYDKKDDRKRNHFKKKRDKSMHNDQSLCWAWAIHLEERVVLAQDLLCTLVLGLDLAQAAGTTTITVWLKMTASWVRSPSPGTCTPLWVMMADVFITLTRGIPFLSPSLLQ